MIVYKPILLGVAEVTGVEPATPRGATAFEAAP